MQDGEYLMVHCTSGEGCTSYFANWFAFDEAPTHGLRLPGKVGRNAPCPCDSGKKFKACRGKG